MLIASRNAFLTKPYDAEVEYLESTGTQWIDTEISRDTFPNSLGYRIKLNPLEEVRPDPATRSFCGYSNYGSRWFGVNYTTAYNRGMMIGCGTNAYSSSLVTLTDYEVYVSSIDGIFINGASVDLPYSTSVARDGTSFYVFAICARDSSGVNHVSPRRCRIYSLTMYDGVNVLQDFQPVRFTNEYG